MADREKLKARFEELKDSMEVGLFGTVGMDEVEAVLELIREQEPRVMTLEEVKGFRDKPVWLEENTPQGSYGAWGVMKGFHDKYNAVNIGGVRFTYWPRARYNIDWRCWTARPTEEQRKAVKWNAEP